MELSFTYNNRQHHCANQPLVSLRVAIQAGKNATSAEEANHWGEICHDIINRYFNAYKGTFAKVFDKRDGDVLFDFYADIDFLPKPEFSLYDWMYFNSKKHFKAVQSTNYSTNNKYELTFYMLSSIRYKNKTLRVSVNGTQLTLYVELPNNPYHCVYDGRIPHNLETALMIFESLEILPYRDVSEHQFHK